MTKDTFLKELKYHLRFLSHKEIKEELKNYENLDNYDEDPLLIANIIYQKKGLKYQATRKIKFLEATNILVDNLKGNDKETIKKILLFFLYMFFLIILIKVPFIYIRDMISNIFIDLFKQDHNYTILALIIEFVYAITSITLFIVMIKKKALEIEKNTK